MAHGGFTARELAAPLPEKAAEKYASFVDHQLSWALTDLKREGLLENPKWGSWLLTNTGRAVNATASWKRADATRLAELRSMPYRSYLRTPEWRQARAEALLRAGYACSLDVSHTANLDVHHRTYERLGAELATDLVVLCRSCHQMYHDEYGRPRRGQTMVARPKKKATLTQSRGANPSRKRSILRRLFVG